MIPKILLWGAVAACILIALAIINPYNVNGIFSQPVSQSTAINIANQYIQTTYGNVQILNDTVISNQSNQWYIDVLYKQLNNEGVCQKVSLCHFRLIPPACRQEFNLTIIPC
jgi:hypothetical protein